jgi:hypothetical protein
MNDRRWEIAKNEYSHKLFQPLGVKILIRVIFEYQRNFRASPERVTTRISVHLKRAFLRVGAEYVLDRIRVLVCLWWDGRYVDTVRDQETRVETKTECTNEIASAGCVCAALCLLQELGRARLRECSLREPPLVYKPRADINLTYQVRRELFG